MKSLTSASTPLGHTKPKNCLAVKCLVWIQCDVCAVVTLGLPLPALFVREISVHMTALIFLQITSIFQWWVSCSVSKLCSGSKCWRWPGRAVTTCHSVPATSLSPWVQDALYLCVSSVVTQFEGIKCQEINGHPIDCPLSSSLPAGPVLSFYTSITSLTVYGFVWCM